MKKLDTFITRRNELADQYRKLLDNLPIELPPSAPHGFLHGYHLFAVLVPERARVFSEMRARGIGVQVHYVPIHCHPSTRSINILAPGLSGSENIYSRILSLPIHPGLTRRQQSQVVETLYNLIKS